MKTKAPPAVDLLFRAFADRTRLRILHMLAEGELCVCDIVGVLDVPQPKASRHLAYLRRAGLVEARKEGLWSYYRLAPARTKVHEKLLDCLACCFSDATDLSRDRRTLDERLEARRRQEARRKCCRQ